ncbi:MAG: sulfide/dihydroorotate dehydrogenase-like FAD/NAD-binding protein [bacterium]
MHRIISNKPLAPATYDMIVEAPLVARKRKAGQFVIVRMRELSERIPLTIAGADPAAGTLRLIYQEVGKSTMEMGRMKAGESLLDVVGPLGRPTHLEKFGTVVCIGGGIGTGEILPVAEGCKEAGNRVISIVGARTKELLIVLDEMEKTSDELLISTDDGSFGYHGFVTGLLQQVIERGEKIDRVFAVGPVPMMRAVCNLTKKYSLPTEVSLNPIMVDGTGMCGACRVTVGGKTQFVCVDGPDFDGHLVDFDELTQRQQAYRVFEQQAVERWKEHLCRLEEVSRS